MLKTQKLEIQKLEKIQNILFTFFYIQKCKYTNLRLRGGAVCAVGWEPNPAHTPVLVRLEEAYNRCGWKVTTSTL